MNVLMTADTVGGVWNYSVELCRALAPHGIHVVLATMGAPLSQAQRAQAAALRNVDVRESTFQLEWMDDPWDDVGRAGDWLLGLERAVSPDVVHLNGYAHGVLPWSAPALAIGHSCVLSWWRAVRGTDAPPEWDRYREAVRAGLHAVQLVVAPTRAMLDALIEQYGPLPHGIVIPNGCDASADADDAAPDAKGRDAGAARPSRRALPEDDARPVVLAAGRTWDESKNMRSLAEAAAGIRATVYVAGSDVHPAHGRLPLEGVNALGMLTAAELRQWYRRAAVFVQPSLYEPFGLAPLEAALQRCALVLGDIPSLREVWDDAAQYVAPRSPAAIAAAVNSLIDEPHRLELAAAAALQRARTMTAARMADAYSAAYRTLAARAVTLRGAVTCVS
jgi:glycogen(starch) synthase